MAGAFDRTGQFALVGGAGSSLPSRADLAGFGDEPAQQAGVFVINGETFVGAELAYSGASIAILLAAARAGTSPLRL